MLRVGDRAGAGEFLAGAGKLMTGELKAAVYPPGSARGEEAELVALGVGQDRPRHVALADVGVGGAESPQPGGLRRLVAAGVRAQVEVDAVLNGLHAGHAEELQVRADAL